MTRSLNVVAVAGSVQRPSRTLVLLEELLAELARHMPVNSRLIDLGHIGPQLAGALYRPHVGPAVEAEIAAIEAADLLVVATPVYRATYPGLFKHLFDLVHHEALIDKPVLLAATGGSERHALVIDHQLRPLFSFFQARTLPLGVYATERDFDGYRLTQPALRERLTLAVQRALPLLNLPASAAPVAKAA